jgi:hypothetical protein
MALETESYAQLPNGWREVFVKVILSPGSAVMNLP